mmetsp:Transcript_119910/g.335764  ORF Transcript_119910/g.335764 Transcript_119910/m.335764 type:complete len:326 (-) Transcript_119910:383-1360(-)
MRCSGGRGRRDDPRGRFVGRRVASPHRWREAEGAHRLGLAGLAEIRFRHAARAGLRGIGERWRRAAERRAKGSGEGPLRGGVLGAVREAGPAVPSPRHSRARRLARLGGLGSRQVVRAFRRRALQSGQGRRRAADQVEAEVLREVPATADGRQPTLRLRQPLRRANGRARGTPQGICGAVLLPRRLHGRRRRGGPAALPLGGRRPQEERHRDAPGPLVHERVEHLAAGQKEMGVARPWRAEGRREGKARDEQGRRRRGCQCLRRPASEVAERGREDCGVRAVPRRDRISTRRLVALRRQHRRHGCGHPQLRRASQLRGGVALRQI